MGRFLRNKYFQMLVVLAVGVGVGATFYPTQSIEQRVEQRVSKQYERVLQERAQFYEKELKTVSEREDRAERRHVEETKTYEKRVNSLTEENRSLRQKVTQKTFKLVKPDGTVLEKTFSQSDTQVVSSVITSVRSEFTRKVQKIENKWRRVHKDRVVKLNKEFQKKIDKLQKEHRNEVTRLKSERVVKINEKKWGVEAGATLEKRWYVHPTASLYGPLYAGGHVSFDQLRPVSAGLGIGIRF